MQRGTGDLKSLGPLAHFFLDAVVALEAFDGRQRGKGPLKKAVYKAQRPAALGQSLGHVLAAKISLRLGCWVPHPRSQALPLHPAAPALGCFTPTAKSQMVADCKVRDPAPLGQEVKATPPD